MSSGLVDLLYVFLDDATYELPAALPELLLRQFVTKARVSATSRRLAAEVIRKAADRMQLELEKVQRAQHRPRGTPGLGSYRAGARPGPVVRAACPPQLFRRAVEDAESLSNEFSVEQVHQIVAELYQDVPAALLRVVPQLEDELKVTAKRGAWEAGLGRGR